MNGPQNKAKLGESDNQQTLRYSKRPYFSAVTAGLLLALISSGLVPESKMTNFLSAVVRPLVSLVPSAALIASSTVNPQVSEVILLLQWPFLVVYSLVFFLTYPPWSQWVHRVAEDKGRASSPAKIIFFLAAGLFVLGIYLLGDFGVIDMATFFNGKLAYPPADAVPQLKSIYGSRMALAHYAWFSPLAESLLSLFFCFSTHEWQIPHRRSASETWLLMDRLIVRSTARRCTIRLAVIGRTEAVMPPARE